MTSKPAASPLGESTTSSGRIATCAVPAGAWPSNQAAGSTLIAGEPRRCATGSVCGLP